MFSDDEKRAIRRLCLWPKLGTCFLFSLFPGLAVWIACIAVDDNEDNCIGARVAGMHAYHFTGDVATLEATVRQLA
ncbi:MAG: hypothetical protein Q4B91_06885 [Atopobiaceae bacterium]|nr:hypothetical protein [Atopobiaceae bacterium]